MKNILNLSETIKKLNKEDKELFSRIFLLTQDYGILKLPEKLKPWVKKQFGSIKAVEKQKVVRIDNIITYETALFNELRSKRPIESTHHHKIDELIKSKQGGPFCKPITNTPSDNFGRVKGKESVSASNIAKYDSMHGLVIFKEHNPLNTSEGKILDYFKTAEKWIKKAYQEDKKRKYPYLLWNCLWKSGASIVHGHMQIIMGKNRHYGEIEKLKEVSIEYLNAYGTSYFSDWYKAHEVIGLGTEKDNVKIFVNLCAKKDKEVVIIANTLKKASKAVNKTINAYKKMGVESFNLGAYLSPMDKEWELPVIIRLVDRGELSNNTTDIGGVEMFAGSSVISTDPYKVIEKIKKEF